MRGIEQGMRNWVTSFQKARTAMRGLREDPDRTDLVNEIVEALDTDDGQHRRYLVAIGSDVAGHEGPVVHQIFEGEARRRWGRHRRCGAGTLAYRHQDSVSICSRSGSVSSGGGVCGPQPVTTLLCPKPERWTGPWSSLPRRWTGLPAALQSRLPL